MVARNGAAPAARAKGGEGQEEIADERRSPSRNLASPQTRFEVFRLRCICRARLWATDEIDLGIAVDELQESAVASGLVELVGQDEVQRLMAEAFGAVRDEFGASAEYVDDDEYDGLSSTFAAACRKADAAQRARPIDARLARLRELMGDDVSIERAYAELSRPAGVARPKPIGKAFSIPPVDGISAHDIAERIRPLLADTSRSTKERIRILWAAAKAARHALEVRDVFIALATETNLIDRRGRWVGADVRADLRRHGAEDVEHVIAWALRGWNPFEKGPLK